MRLLFLSGRQPVFEHDQTKVIYNEVDDGAYRDLRELHDALDEAVAAAYGWPSSAAHDPQESNRLLLELNRAIAAGEIDYRPFG